MKIKAISKQIKCEINLTASKSESNRALIIQALSNSTVGIDNLAAADDTQTLKKLLKSYKSEKLLDVGPAGTTMRFLTAFLCTQKGSWEVTGSERMLQRPIGILVDALRQLGAQITYKKVDGYPPLLIEGGLDVTRSEIAIDGSVSSQFLSALLLIAPSLEKGLRLKLTGKTTSIPYLKMTLSIMEQLGAKSRWEGNEIIIENGPYPSGNFNVEADWSSASYWFQIAALSDSCEITLHGLKENSLQGDAACIEIFDALGVKSEFIAGKLILTKKSSQKHLDYNFESCPDLAQTVVCTCAALGISSNFTGLHTLKIKETDRSLALKTELEKFGAHIGLTNDSELVIPSIETLSCPSEKIATYHDHRMAMAFAPMVLKVGELGITDPEVVSKSYPDFWKDLEKAGFVLQDY